MRMNNKGFLLMETLITTCIIAILATSIYVYISKTIDNYEKRDKYDNVVDVYKVNNIAVYCKQSNDNCKRKDVNPNKCILLNSRDINEISNGAENIYICKGKGFKNEFINNGAISDKEYKEYVRLLPLTDMEDNDYILIASFKDSQGRKKSFASLKIKSGS